MTDDSIESRLANAERSVERMRKWLVISVVFVLLLVTGVSFWIVQEHRQLSDATSLVTRELVVVDSSGTERVRIGGNLPDAVIDGRRIPRGQEAAGILLYDETGQERSRYVTLAPSGNVSLTLDTREQQVAFITAGPDDGVALRLWDSSRENWVGMRADDAGGARVLAGRSGELAFHEPPMQPAQTEAICGEFNQELNELDDPPPPETLLAACRRNLTDEACRLCLDIP